ncbi:hypothetical protein DJ68_12930 [Halorubrum sp. C3]|nr:hypothetical protein DJ68_12930 [Halorubrum sp. C3]
MVASLTISVELELGWGMHDVAEYSHLSKERRNETEYTLRFLDLTDQLNVPITFNVVGHLLHQSCDGHHLGPYPDGWWSEDPGTDMRTNPLFYAPDLVEEICDRPTDHEVATHTYSHLLAEQATVETLDTDLLKALETHASFGLPSPTSIILPRHQQPEYQILRKHGIKTIRQLIKDYGRPDINPISKTWWILTRDHPMSTLRERNAVLETTVTPHPSLTSSTLPSGQSPPHPVFRTIPVQIRQRLHRKYLIAAIDRAIDRDRHLHLWTHVFNFANEYQYPPIECALKHLARRRNEGKVHIRRMSDLHL